jgi:hypothetical protein
METICLKTLKDIIGGNNNGPVGWEDSRHHGRQQRVGLTTAKEFVREGAYVFITARNQQEFEFAGCGDRRKCAGSAHTLARTWTGIFA